MGNVLDNMSKDNTRFTIFENDQVLTADQLNDLFNYLDVQSRLTRSQAIGVGIICGLEIGMLENKNIVLSKGSAITTDGDLLFVPNDLEFDQIDLFEDINANYPYFQSGNGLNVPLYSLSRSEPGVPSTAQELSQFETDTNTSLQDYIGVLYLEDYNNDPDVCSGTDCDNKGIEAARELKVLLIHKTNLQLLLRSIPPSNKEYFSMTDIAVPRVRIQTTIDTYQELKDAFNNALSIKEVVKQKLNEAYQICKLMLEDEFEGGDPTSEWNSAIDTHFSLSNSIYVQYLYDFARDLSYAYSELRETLFSSHGVCCPDVDLFPKHVMLGLVKAATIKSTPLPSSPISSPIIARDFLEFANPSLRARLTGRFPPINLRFTKDTLFRRFDPIHIDLEYRHQFYASPILNKGNESIEHTRFCFMRVNALIKNFKVPTAEELQNIEQNLKITPSHFEDKPLGERSIPFYYRFTRDLPTHLYWDFNANIRKRETSIYSYFANLYSNNPAVHSPLLFDILPYNFFRIEGHIGFSLNSVEAALNKVILDNNLPINILSVQVEKKPETIPQKPWFFPHLYMYEKSVQKTFIDRLEKADLVNEDLKIKDTAIPTDEYKVAKQAFMDTNKDVGNPEFNFSQMKSSVSNVITAAANIKANTKQYTFSNAATPHDFVSNTDVLQKTDILSNLFQQQIIKKKEGLMLGNFLKLNPGLEHTGGVFRGGTFVLVYTSDDKKVVADFMLPYASIDKDVVVDPPVYRPLPIPEPPIIKFPVDTLFEAVPHYKIDLNQTISEYAKLDDLTTQINSKVDEKLVDVEAKLDLKLAVTNTKVDGLTPQLNSFDERLKDNSNLFNNVFTSGIKTVPNIGGKLSLGDQDLTREMLDFNQKQKVLEETPPDAPDRVEKENALIEAANVLAEKIKQPEIADNPQNALAVKGIISDLHTGTSLVKNADLKSKTDEIATRLNDINRGLNKFR